MIEINSRLEDENKKKKIVFAFELFKYNCNKDFD